MRKHKEMVVPQQSEVWPYTHTSQVCFAQHLKLLVYTQTGPAAPNYRVCDENVCAAQACSYVRCCLVVISVHPDSLVDALGLGASYFAICVDDVLFVPPGSMEKPTIDL